MKIIPLTRGYVAKVDDADYERMRRYKWHVAISKGKAYASRRVDFAEKTLMHRELLDAETGELVDHRNGDGLDNQRHNLRKATRAQNAQNRPGPRPGLKGVRWSDYKQCWQAVVRADGHRHIFSGFTTPEEAARAYDEQARRLHGEFARPNDAPGSVKVSAAPPAAPVAESPHPAPPDPKYGSVGHRQFRLFKRDAKGKELPASATGWKFRPFYVRFEVAKKKYVKTLGTADKREAIAAANALYAAAKAPLVAAHYENMAKVSEEFRARREAAALARIPHRHTFGRKKTSDPLHTPPQDS